MANVSLYIAATPWNFLNSFVFAEHRKEEQSYLMYVDFPIGQENPYLEALQKIGADSPFTESWCFHGKFKGAIAKWRSRVDELKQIRQIVAELKPDQVFVGSDRRIEFQCAMTEAVKHRPQVKGIYLDEGVFSYTGRKRSQTWRDRVLDSWIKKLMYPCDWKHPITIGASDWISEGWLLKPEKACSLFEKKIALHKIPLEYYSVPSLASLLNNFLTKEEDRCLQKTFDLLIILPHPSNLPASLQQQFVDFIDSKDWQRIAIKKHPRDNSDLNWLTDSVSSNKEFSVEVLPTVLPLELILPRLSFSYVVSAPSTALLTVKLLKQNVQIKVLSADGVQKNEVLENLIT